MRILRENRGRGRGRRRSRGMRPRSAANPFWLSPFRGHATSSAAAVNPVKLREEVSASVLVVSSNSNSSSARPFWGRSEAVRRPPLPGKARMIVLLQSQSWCQLRSSYDVTTRAPFPSTSFSERSSRASSSSTVWRKMLMVDITMNEKKRKAQAT